MLLAQAASVPALRKTGEGRGTPLHC